MLLGSLVLCDLDKWIGFGEFLETEDEFGKILWGFGSNSNSNNRRHRVFHHSDVVGFWVSTDSTLLEDELVNTNEGNSVTAWDI